MHKDNITNILVASKTHMVITVSADGHIKMWRKVFRLIEFVKHFRAHTGFVTCA